jgi:hypothetical protein
MVPGDISDSFSSLHHGVSKWFVSESVQSEATLKSSLKQSEEHHLASHSSFDY